MTTTDCGCSAGLPLTGGGGRSVTKDDLYRRAKALDIAGRSTMTKAELARAIARHEKKTTKPRR